MPLRLSITRATLLPPNRAFVQWDVTGTPMPSGYRVRVERGQSAEGPWEYIAEGYPLYNLIDQFVSAPVPAVEFQEQYANVLSLARQIYYRVSMTVTGGETLRAVTPLEPQLPDRQRLARRKMLRDAAVLMAKGNGVPVAVCKRARWGPRCGECRDPYTGDVLRGECLACYGTGFQPGYMNPIITYARRSPNATQSVVSEGGKTDTNLVQITMLDVPRVQDDDLIVFLPDNGRYIVKTSAQTELKTVGVHQELTASELAHSAIEYRFPVDPLTTPRLF